MTMTAATTEILLVRHAEAESNRDRRFGGQGDFPLTERGARQAERVARAIAASPVAVLYSSDSTRARQTAAPIARATGLSPITTPLLRERSVGAITGLTFAETELHYPEHFAAMMRRDPDAVPPGGGESHRMCAERAAEFLDGLLARRHSGRVVVVSHGVTINHVLRQLLGLPVDGPLSVFQTDNTGVHRLEWRDGGPLRVLKLNDTSHLDGLEPASPELPPPAPRE